MYSACQGHVELAIRRDESPVDYLGQGEIQTIVETALRLKRQGIGWPEEPSISMVLQRNLAHLFQNYLSLFRSQLSSTDLLRKNIPQFQQKNAGTWRP